MLAKWDWILWMQFIYFRLKNEMKLIFADNLMLIDKHNWNFPRWRLLFLHFIFQLLIRFSLIIRIHFFFWFAIITPLLVETKWLECQLFSIFVVFIQVKRNGKRGMGWLVLLLTKCIVVPTWGITEYVSYNVYEC